MALPATDNFNRADAGSLGANWTEQTNGAKIVSNAAHGVNTSVDQRAYWNADVFDGDHYSEVLVSLVVGGPIVRAQSGANTAYLLQVQGANYILYKVVAGSYTGVGSGSGSSAPATWRLEVTGTSIDVISNGSTVATHSDGTISGGSAGIYLDAPGTTLDDWEGGNLGGGGGGGSKAPSTLTLMGVQ
jgi:hypothetical protein